MERADGTYSANSHGDRFFADVVAMVKGYLETRPDPAVTDFLRYSFDELTDRFGGVTGTAFRGYPSYPQRYTEVMIPQPPAPEVSCRVEPLQLPRVPTTYSERDLVRREFLRSGSRRLSAPTGSSRERPAA
jgi:hypothetical protein